MKIMRFVLVFAAVVGVAVFVFVQNRQAKLVDSVRSSAHRPGAPRLRPATPVALVNSVPITSGELQEEVDRLLPPTVSHGHTDEQQNAKFRKEALDELVVRELAYQKAKAMRLQADADELNAVVAKIKGRYKTEQNFQEALRAEGISQQEFTRRIEKDLLLRKIYKQGIDEKTAVGDAELKDYYDNNKARFVRPETIHLMHIVVKANAKDPNVAKKKINEAIRKIKSGQPFDVVAYKYSEDDYRVLGGDYGTVHRGQLAPELEAKAFRAQLKTIVGPFQSSFGWHILRIENREAERQMKFDEVKDRIAATLRQKRLDQVKSEFVRELKSSAKVQYLMPV